LEGLKVSKILELHVIFMKILFFKALMKLSLLSFWGDCGIPKRRGHSTKNSKFPVNVTELRLVGTVYPNGRLGF